LVKSDKFVGPFEVYIDSELNYEGELVWSEAFHKGASNQEILISTYACHPSMANDNLSGLVTARLFFDYISKFETKYSYRFIVIPETIGALCFLNNHENPKKIVAGFVVTCTAGPGKFGIKLAFDEDHWINDFSLSALKESGNIFDVYPFVPDGSDERQYAAPGFRIPTVSITSDKYYEYPEYHTSADNLEFVSVDRLLEVLAIHKKVFHEIESSFIPKRTSDKGEYQLGKRNLFPSLGGSIYQSASTQNTDKLDKEIKTNAFGWIMHLADGTRSIDKIATKSKLPSDVIIESVEIFKKEGLLKCLSDYS
jgi:aminopeptidase-like protein